MTNEQAVKPKQLWVDTDPRNTYRGRLAKRFVYVKAVDETHATCEAWYDEPGMARTTRIRLDRFRPTRSGYRPATPAEVRYADVEVSE